MSATARTSRSDSERDSERVTDDGPATAPECRSIPERISGSTPGAPREAGGPAEPADEPGPDHSDVELLVDAIGDLLAVWELGAVHRFQSLAGRLGFTVREHLVLSELSRWPAGLANAQICGITGLPSATVAELVTTLEVARLVERWPDLVDGRRVLSAVTDAARERLADGTRHPWAVAALLQGLDPRQNEAVAIFLNRAADAVYRDSRELRTYRRV